MHAAMRMCQKCKPSSDKNQVEEVGYELADLSMSADVTGECASSQVSKQQQADSLCHQTTTTCLNDIYIATQEQWREPCEHHKKIVQVHNWACDIQEHAVDVQEHAVDVQEHAVDVQEHAIDVQEHAVDVQEHAVDVQEHMSLALLDILCQSLLPPHV